MLKFDYRDAVKKDIFKYLKENYRNDKIFDYIYKDSGEFFVEFDEDFSKKIIKEVQEDDYITGYGNGSYVYDKATAKKYVLADGIDVLERMRFDGLIDRGSIGGYFLDENWQAMDSNVRWYCCFEMTSTAVNEFKEYLNEQNALLKKIYIECGGCEND